MIHKNQNLRLNRNVTESDKEYIMRQWFVAKNIEKHKYDFVTLEMLSNHYIKKNIYGMSFNDNIMKILKECEEELYC